MMIASSSGNADKGKGGGKNRFGPANETKEARLLHTGSVSMRIPSISISTLECPIHVMRNPLAGVFRKIVASVINGPGLIVGTTSSFDTIYCQRVYHKVPGSINTVGTGFKNSLPFFCAF